MSGNISCFLFVSFRYTQEFCALTRKSSLGFFQETLLLLVIVKLRIVSSLLDLILQISNFAPKVFLCRTPCGHSGVRYQCHGICNIKTFDLHLSLLDSNSGRTLHMLLVTQRWKRIRIVFHR